LFRIKVLKKEIDDFIFVVTCHHIISDGWSLGIITKEIFEIYNSIIENRKTNLQDLKIQYADYSIWQKEFFKSDFVNKQIEYWKNKLSGNLPVIDLPFNRPRKSIQTFTGDNVNSILNEEIFSKIKTFCSILFSAEC